MKKIPFDVEKSKSGEYRVVTREGEPARVVDYTFDCFEKMPIVAIYRSKGEEHIAHYNIHGKIGSSDHFCDLFLVSDEPDYTEFENTLCNIFSVFSGMDPAEEDVKEWASELIKIAEREILPKPVGYIVNIDKGKVPPYLTDSEPRLLVLSDKYCVSLNQVIELYDRFTSR